MGCRARRYIAVAVCALMCAGCAKKSAGFPAVGDSDGGSRSDTNAQLGDDGGPVCPLACVTERIASFQLSCGPNDLTSVVASGPCSAPDASVSEYAAGSNGSVVFVGSTGPGTCHVQLTFATGFTYAADVTFALLPLLGPPGCPSCPPYLGPTQGPFMVDNPAETCTDAGVEGAAPSDADVFDGDGGLPCGDQPLCEPPFETCVTGPALGAECCHVVSDPSGPVLDSCRPCEGGGCSAATSTPDGSIDASQDGSDDGSG